MKLEIRDGEMLALLGPSGCGKSTTLFAICGIHKVTGGRILFGDKRRDAHRPSQERNVGVVFQSYALYPHKTVAENIAFPLQVRRLALRRNQPAGDTRWRGSSISRSFSAAGRPNFQAASSSAWRWPARWCAGPDVLLLDEPLANLDAKLRLEMRSEIRRIQLETGITADPGHA